MNSIVKQDPQYIVDNRERPVFELEIVKDGRQANSMMLTIPELQDVANAIITFLEDLEKKSFTTKK